MALTNAAQIGSDNSYTGNAGLGEVGGNPIVIDTRPLRELAAYSFDYNRILYNQKQKDAEANARELADITAYDLTTAIPKDREEIQKGYNELYDFVRNDPTVLDYKNNQKGWMEYNKKKNDFENKLRGGKVRNLMYLSRQKQASEAITPALKEYYQKSLDNEANSTSIDTPLKYTQQFDLAPVSLAPPPSKKLDVTSVAPMFNITRTWELPDMSSVNAQASAKSLGLFQSNLDESSPEFQAKSEEEKQLIRDEYQAKSAAGDLEPIKSSENITAVLANPKYQDPKFLNDDGTANIDAIIKDNAGNGLVSGVLESINQYNKKMDEMTSQIKAGYFKDNLGNVVSFGAGGLNENDYAKIDVSDGVSPNELLKVRILGLAKPVTYTTKIDQTNAAIAKQNADTSRGQLAETIRNNKANQALRGKEFQLNADKWKASQTGSTTQINGAMVRAKRIYSDLLKLTDKNGVISPDKMRKLNAEQLKYLGTEQIQTSDAGVSKSVFTPLDISPYDEDGKRKTEYAIQLVNGEIRVMRPKEGENRLQQTPDGLYVGLWDPSKSTNVYNVGTNILNEELKNSGSKELNTYMGVDITNGITSSTEGGNTVIQGSSFSNQSQTSGQPISLTGKIDPSTLITGQSYSVGGKQYIWDGKKLKAQ